MKKYVFPAVDAHHKVI